MAHKLAIKFAAAEGSRHWILGGLDASQANVIASFVSTDGENPMMKKLLLAAIALGLWANVWVTLVRPTSADNSRSANRPLAHAELHPDRTS